MAGNAANMLGLKIRLARNRAELAKVLKVREEVFVKGQRVPLGRERDGLDATSKHVIVLLGGKAVGCARIRFVGGKAKLERIAVLEKYRGTGLGKKLMAYILSYCRRRKARKIVMHSQHYVKGFYEKFGFRQKGGIFMDAGIKHVELWRKP